MKEFLQRINIEFIFLSAGMIYLIFFIPAVGFSICPLKNLGIEICPGCGLGNSISLIAKMEIESAFAINPLGFLALPVIILRIIKLAKNLFSTKRKNDE